MMCGNEPTADDRAWYGRKPNQPPLTEHAIKIMLDKRSLVPPRDGPGPSATSMWLEAAGITLLFGAVVVAAYFYIQKP